MRITAAPSQRHGRASQRRSRRYRTLFISDVHLGTRGCQAERLLDFLRDTRPTRSTSSATSSTAGRCKRGWYWPQSHNDVVQKLLRKARKGARIVYVPGNHDEFLRDYLRHAFRRHRGGRRRDPRGRRRAALSRDARRPVRPRGDAARAGSRCSATRPTTSRSRLNRIFNAVRRRLGFPYWSLSQWAKLKVKNAVSYIGDFEKTLVAEARAPRRRRRDLRPHPSRRDPRRVRRALHQLRRLGRKLHRDRRASRRPVRDHHLVRGDGPPRPHAAGHLAGCVALRPQRSATPVFQSAHTWCSPRRRHPCGSRAIDPSASRRHG